MAFIIMCRWKCARFSLYLHMALFELNDTICALSTPPGMGAIAVIRVSGPESFRTIASILHPAGK